MSRGYFKGGNKLFEHWTVTKDKFFSHGDVCSNKGSQPMGVNFGGKRVELVYLFKHLFLFP